MIKEKAAVALSGGVDSSLAALLLLKKGYDVMGVTMVVTAAPGNEKRRMGFRDEFFSRGVEEAGAAARFLGIPFQVIDMRESFERLVVSAFIRDYVSGLTPNPCIICNQAVKFGLLWDAVLPLGVKKLAAGHHARIDIDPQSGIFRLRKGRDREKDQSYFLYRLSQEQLSRSLMPVGELTKEQVRKTAAAAAIPGAENPESQEICFIPENDYASFLERRIPSAVRPGPIKNRQGRVLGKHKGIIHYTVGQRRGLGIAWPSPLYVTSIDPFSNTVFAGPEEDLYRETLTASRVCWMRKKVPRTSFRVKAKIRSQQDEADAEVEFLGPDRARVAFSVPQRAVAPGQSVVFYNGDTVLGGGFIDP